MGFIPKIAKGTFVTVRYLTAAVVVGYIGLHAAVELEKSVHKHVLPRLN